MLLCKHIDLVPRCFAILKTCCHVALEAWRLPSCFSAGLLEATDSVLIRCGCCKYKGQAILADESNGNESVKARTYFPYVKMVFILLLSD